ncbi:MAG TPA: hypothetical protein VE755_10765 [Myxococcales bacterium]|jgi:hypothetical protein|nr:hypothetical protein [Myxococcales bacterium]
MSVVWPAICALAALAAGVQQAPSGFDAPQMRTKALPGYGYIRYEVLPGDDQADPGELIVVHEERRQALPQTEATALPPPAPASASTEPKACTALRGKLLARIFEVQGIQVEPEFAQWLERNLAMGTPDLRTVQVYGGQPLLMTALQADGTARSLAEDLARCEQGK